jgi:hypothetical protein
MHNPGDFKKEELLPLRKIALDSPYSTAYLSQLVQRGKLKAIKQGRNYYCTQEWFRQYLRQHGRLDKHQEFKAQNNKIQKSIKSDIMQEQAGFFVAEKSQHQGIKSFAIGVLSTLLILLVLNTIYMSDKGRVAGEEESFNSINDIKIGTSTKDKTIYNIY